MSNNVALQQQRIESILKGNPDAELIVHQGLQIIKYTSTRGNPCLAVWQGKQAKPFIHYSYSATPAGRFQREDRITKSKNWEDESIAAKAQIAANRAKPNQLKVGDLLHYSWGWEQTNAEFYQVLESKGSTVKIREVKSERVSGDFWAGQVVGLKDQFVEETSHSGEILTKRVHHGTQVTLKYGNASLWDGKPKYDSNYA